MIKIEVVYADSAQQALYCLEVPDDATVAEAIRASGVLMAFPALDLQAHRVGIHGKIATLEARLREGDRVEIYRSLIADPKEARRARASPRKAAQRRVP